MRSKRQIKKLHKKWLELGAVDASQVSYWRELLFKSEFNNIFELNYKNSSGLPDYFIEAMRKYELEYLISKIPATEAPSWLSDGGLVIFRVWAKDFPSVYIETGNNPSVL